MNHEALVRLALECGAAKAAILPQSQIVTSAAFRDICAGNGCGLYGKCWMCPPDIGDIEPLMASVRRFPYALWYQTVSDLEDSFDFEGMSEAGYAHMRVSRKLQEAVAPLLPEDALHLSCGGAGCATDARSWMRSPAVCLRRPCLLWRPMAWMCIKLRRIRALSM